MGRTARSFLHAVCCGVAAVITLGAALTPVVADLEQGRRLARFYCARCHAIDKVSPSPLTIAPPFRTLHEHYPVEMLEEALAEGIVTGHPTMPEFSFEPDQVNDFILFLKSLEDSKAGR
ncbi:c-type cytochrome [Bradyrhizobium erythrophlei]|uniref:c-type cytochrome n=1 Tax=Bradyrhizobium erythrophlei TaxID=1437360 RepID=UPI0035EDECFC